MVTGIVGERDVNKIVIIKHVVNYNCDICCEEILVTGRWWSPRVMGIQLSTICVNECKAKNTLRGTEGLYHGFWVIVSSLGLGETLAGEWYVLYTGCRALIAVQRSLNLTID